MPSKKPNDQVERGNESLEVPDMPPRQDDASQVTGGVAPQKKTTLPPTASVPGNCPVIRHIDP